MSFFAVQVRTGSEIQVKKMLQDVLGRKGNQGIKAICALESYSRTVNENTHNFELTDLTSTDINDCLYIQRLQTNLSNLRAAVNQLRSYKDASSIKLMEEYQKQISIMTAKMKSIRDTTKKISSVLKGYILIEVEQALDYLPTHLWHLIKSIPKVTGFPSRMNIPQYEVDAFFEVVDMSNEVELQFDKILTFEQEKAQESKFVQELNQTNTEEHQEVISQRMDDMHTDVEQEISNMKSYSNHLVQRVKAFVKNQRKTVKMPAKLFQELYQKVKVSIPTQMKSSSVFIQQLKQWLQQSQVVLE